MKNNTLEDYMSKCELYIFMLLMLLQVNFFHLPFLSQGLVALNSDINKQIVLLVVIGAFCIFTILRYTLKNYKTKYSLGLSISILIITLAVLTVLTSQAYKIPLFQIFKNSYYYWIVIYFFPCVFVIKNYFNEAILVIKGVAIIDIIVILAQDMAYFKFGKLVLSLDEFSLSMLNVNGRFVTDSDFLLFTAFVILLVSVWSKNGIGKIDIIYLGLLTLHLVLFSKGRVTLLILLFMFAGYLIFYITKLSVAYQYVVLLLYAVIGVAILYKLIIRLSFFSGERAISGQVRLYEIQYYLEAARYNKFWGIGFTNDNLLLHGGIGQLLGGKYSVTDVGLVGYFGLFGYLGFPFIIVYFTQLIRLCINSRSLSVTIIAFAYFVGQCGTLFPLNLPRIFLFSVASAFLVVLLNINDFSIKDRLA